MQEEEGMSLALFFTHANIRGRPHTKAIDQRVGFNQHFLHLEFDCTRMCFFFCSLMIGRASEY